MTYYIYIQNDKLNGCGQARQLTEGVTNLEVDESLYNAYAENPDMYIWDGSEVAIDPEWEAKQAQKEVERVNSLMLDSTNFYKEILRTSSNTRKDIQNLIQLSNTFSDYQKESLLIDLQNTLNLIRGSYFVNTIGILLDYTTEDLNYLFENKIFPY